MKVKFVYGWEDPSNATISTKNNHSKLLKPLEKLETETKKKKESKYSKTV